MGSASRIRKPIDDLSRLDFAGAPIWEFATDEEGAPGQDETWVRPSRHSTIPRDGRSLQVAADFTLGDGTAIPGFIDVTTDERAQFGDGAFSAFALFRQGGISHIQSAELTPREVRQVVRELGKPWERVFPIRFLLRAVVEGETESRSGEIDGDAF